MKKNKIILSVSIVILPLYGQLVFFLPAGAEGPAELVLGEATADASGGACHTVALELP